MFYIEHSIFELAFLLLPNNVGFLNYEAYINHKGYFEAFVTTMFITDMLKFLVGEKRPDYKSRLDNGNKKEILEGQRAFPSGHSSHVFVGTTYFTLFMFQYLGDNRLHMYYR